MSLGVHVLSDLDVASLSLPTSTPWGNEIFQSRLCTPTSDRKTLQQQQLPLLALRSPHLASFRTLCKEHLTQIASHAYAWQDFTELDPRIAESIEQILWNRESFGSFLNTSRAISFLVFWKTLFLPFVSVILPILAMLAPLVLLRYIDNTPITFREYFQNLKQMALKQVAIPALLRAKHEADVIGHAVEWGFFLLTVGTFLSSLWSQITAAMHLRTIAHQIKAKGDSILCMIQTVEAIFATPLPPLQKQALRPFLDRGTQLLTTFAEMPRTGGYSTYGWVWNTPDCRIAFTEWVGELDAMLAIVSISDICFPVYSEIPTPLQIHQVYHPSLLKSIRNDACWDRSHAILTGPNRGGKSTFCRSVGLSIVCAQSWGFAYASSMKFCPFTYIETALHPSDTLGSMSLFEAEIEFAKRVLTNAKSEHMFVMMDEIFHSTNARDGLAASRVFLSQLYSFSTTTSLISTHYKELPADYPQVLAWAMEAHESEDRLVYTYKKVPGISDKSSVMEILRERGLCGVLKEKTSTPSIRSCK